jgi:predicted enzyme related to lactoylglutathione lyase
VDAHAGDDGSCPATGARANMLPMIEYPPGTPSWVDLSSPDPHASIRFYGDLFGWEAQKVGVDMYWMLLLDGKEVAGLVRQHEPTDPPAWVTYVKTDDAGQTRQNVEAAGGRTIVEPFAPGEAGTVAIFADAAGGAVFGVLQPDRHLGAQVVNAPGALTMNQLNTRDLDPAARFYYGVFGWDFEPIELDGLVVYGAFKLDGRLVAGALPMGEQFPPEAPPNWVPYFGTEDVEATAAKARERGATQLAGPTAVPAGRFVVLSDPHGATFWISEGGYYQPPG